MLKVLVRILIVLLVVVLVAGGWLFSRRFGPHHDYELDLRLPENAGAAAPGLLEVGVAQRDITPIESLYDPWTDVNENGKFDPGEDSFEDRNGNGKFDGIWIAGFGTNRPAKSVNDKQWVRALALRNNGVTVVMVTLDAIGIYHNECVTVRKALDPSLDIDHVLFSSTHCHEVADTMKIWSFWKRIRGMDIPGIGFDPSHLNYILDQTKEAVEAAVRGLAPADMYCTQVSVPEKGFIKDSRDPQVLDPNMYLWRFTKPNSDESIAVFVNWGNHPETLGSKNSALSSDFCHWLREGVERGVPGPNGVEGLGGMCLYFQGMIGGLMTQLGVDVPHRDGTTMLTGNTFPKTQALGENLAIVACKALRSEGVWKNENPLLAVRAKTFMAPIAGTYKYPIMLGLLHEGYHWGYANTEVNVVRIGDVMVLTTPGELYPEIVEGGIKALPGRDFEVPPIEQPPLRSAMDDHARMALVVGLANDEIGYIMPKSQWDNEAPYVYGKKKYGEENSPGPDVAPTYHREALALIEDLNKTFEAAP